MDSNLPMDNNVNVTVSPFPFMMLYLQGLVSGAVSKALTPRTTIAVYGVLFSVGLLGSFLAANVYTLMVCFLLTGML